MLTEVQNDILAQMDTITAFKTRGVWQGDLEDLLKKVQKLPAVYIALASGVFSAATTIPPTSAPVKMGWDVIIVYECLSDRRVAADQGYGLIETVVTALRGLKTQGGLLWPETFDLIDTINGKSAYAVRFGLERKL